MDVSTIHKSSGMRPVRDRAARGGFTLLEVLIAVTIFALAVSALYATFRTGIRAWRGGHNASELFATVRIAQDVIIRDLHNTAYLTELEYNRTFRQQIEEMARQEIMRASLAEAGELEATQLRPTPPPRGSRSRGRAADTEEVAPGLSIDSISPPLDLSFHGEDGGEIDSLTFARFYRPRTFEEQFSAGIRLITYFVEDGVLYRKETSPYGFRPGSDLAAHYEMQSQQGDVARLFYPSGYVAPAPPADEFADEYSVESAMGVAGESRLPDPGATVEPLCQGVEIFNITYGYMRSEQWNEVNTWDSGRYEYRFPSPPILDDFGIGLLSPPSIPPGVTLPAGLDLVRGGNLRPGTETGFVFSPYRAPLPQMAIVNGQPIRFTPRPDNLPGYVAIHLGLRVGGEGKKIRSFTFFISIPMAREEFDTSLVEESGQPNFISPMSLEPSQLRSSRIIR